MYLLGGFNGKKYFAEISCLNIQSMEWGSIQFTKNDNNKELARYGATLSWDSFADALLVAGGNGIGFVFILFHFNDHSNLPLGPNGELTSCFRLSTCSMSIINIQYSFFYVFNNTSL